MDGNLRKRSRVKLERYKIIVSNDILREIIKMAYNRRLYLKKSVNPIGWNQLLSIKRGTAKVEHRQIIYGNSARKDSKLNTKTHDDENLSTELLLTVQGEK